MKKLGVISLICSLLVLSSYLVRLAAFQTDSFGAIDIFLAAVIGIGMTCQFIYVLLTQRLLNLPVYEELHTLDNEMAFSDADQVSPRGHQGPGILLAVIAGLAWAALFFLVGMNSHALLSFYDMSIQRVLLKIFQISIIIGGVPSLIYNLKTWNRMVVR